MAAFHSYFAQVLFISCLTLFTGFAHSKDSCDQGVVNDYRTLVSKMKQIEDTTKHFYSKLTGKERADNQIQNLVFYYDAPKAIDFFEKNVNQLANEDTPKLKARLEPFFVCRLGDKKAAQAKYQEASTRIDNYQRQLEKRVNLFRSAEVTDHVKKNYQLLVQLFGSEDELESTMYSYKVTESIYANIAKRSQRAGVFDMWAVVEEHGVGFFMEKTGINIQKGSPEARKAEEEARGLTPSDLNFMAPPEGEEYPHNHYYFAMEVLEKPVDVFERTPEPEEIVNRNKIAMAILKSSKFETDYFNALSQYKEAMQSFSDKAAQRFQITDWQQIPVSDGKWKSAMQIWAIESRQLMQKRFNAMQSYSDPKAEEDWGQLAETLR